MVESFNIFAGCFVWSATCRFVFKKSQRRCFRSLMQSRSSALRGSNDILRHELTETAKKPKKQKTKTQKTTKKPKTIKKNIPPKNPIIYRLIIIQYLEFHDKSIML